MRGIKSAGMLLAASNAEHTEVEPLVPPQGAAPGSRVWFGQHNEQVGGRCASHQEQLVCSCCAGNMRSRIKCVGSARLLICYAAAAINRGSCCAVVVSLTAGQVPA
jgi:tRNA-binding EMAP/Myf-like protein